MVKGYICVGSQKPSAQTPKFVIRKNTADVRSDPPKTFGTVTEVRKLRPMKYAIVNATYTCHMPEWNPRKVSERSIAPSVITRPHHRPKRAPPNSAIAPIGAKFADAATGAL